MLGRDFFDAVRGTPFPGSLTTDQVDGMTNIDAAWEIYGDGDDRKLAYIFGTAFHECDRFRTMEEYASGSAYEGRSDLGNTQPGDGRRFKGRGFVQITGRRNYSYWSNRLGIDLIAEPTRAAEPKIAARICVEGMLIGSFTNRYLREFITDTKTDFINARRVVNGTDKAALIADYGWKFLKALQAIPEPKPIPVPPVVTIPEPPTYDELVIEAMRAIAAVFAHLAPKDPK